MASATPSTILSLTLYKKNEAFRTLSQSILPWGILEFAIELQDVFSQVETEEDGKLKQGSMNLEGIQKLTDFVIYIFEDDVTRV